MAFAKKRVEKKFLFTIWMVSQTVAKKSRFRHTQNFCKYFLLMSYMCVIPSQQGKLVHLNFNTTIIK